jgi:hypothetical protein
LGSSCARRSLRKIGARIPAGPDDAWTAAEFTDILHRLRRAGYRRPLDLKLNYLASTPEWPAYGFLPGGVVGGRRPDRPSQDYREVDRDPERIRGRRGAHDHAALASRTGFVDPTPTTLRSSGT